MSPFQDHFSERATDYARYRPDYPSELFAYLASLVDPRDVVLDCATGNGQAAVQLATRFSRVIATDPSARQLANRRHHERVRYVRATAEQIPLEDGSIALAAAAQALHWFEPDAFFAEARRVLRRGGVAAVWCYGRIEVAPPVAGVVARLYDIVQPFWPGERQLVDSGYRTVRFPFAELTPPPLAMSLGYTLDEFVGYVGTWSAARRYRQRRSADPVDAVRGELEAAWGSRLERRTVTWPLHLRVGRAS